MDSTESDQRSVSGGDRLSVDVRRRVGPDVARTLASILADPPPIRVPVTVDWEQVVPMTARPGVGGRRVRPPRGVDSEATREVRELLGEPQIQRHRRSRVELYTYDTTGTGVVAVRLSSMDVQNGETALGQARSIIQMCERNELRPRYVVVALNSNSTLEYEDRTDWAVIRQGAAEGWLRWVGYREPERVSRNALAARLFFRDLRGYDIQLWMADSGGLVDFDDPTDVFMLSIRSATGEFGAAQIRRLTHGLIISRWLEEGRGWPKQPRFGFRRDARDFLEVDPEQWPFVQRAHFDYATLDPRGGASVRALEQHLASLGCKLSHATVHRVLTDPMYVTGEWTAMFDGTTYPCKRVEIPDPIPVAVFEQPGVARCRSRSSGTSSGNKRSHRTSTR